MGKLIEGCINPIIKKQLIQGIETSCPRGAVDPLCTTFADQLESLEDCQTYRSERFRELQIPIQRPNAPKPLTDYQKHMSYCLTHPEELPAEDMSQKGPFYSCRDMWNGDNKLHEKYNGPGVTKPKAL